MQQLLDTALEPVLDQAMTADDPETAILALTVVDPACGSGHFLIAAAHRIAKRLATVRTGEGEPPPEATRAALRDVVGRCLYGVDLNPMAVELCKVALWMEAQEPGRPLSFLDHHVKVGNALLGATPALLAGGIPTDAFKELTGDDKKVASSIRKRNTAERSGRTMIAGQLRGARYAEDSLWAAESAASYSALFNDLSDVEALDDSTITGVRAKRQRYEIAIASQAARHAALIADTWCSAFVWPLTPDAPEPPTQAWFSRLERDPDALSPRSREEAATLADQYRWFHWHLEFPQVFDVPDEVAPEDGPAGWASGFSVVLGNPPWERIKLQEQEWFAARAPEIAAAPNAAARKRKITELVKADPELHAAYLGDQRHAECESWFLRASGRYPLCGRGRDINTSSVFSETNQSIVGPQGRAGFIVPSGIATDDTTKEFFGNLVDTSTLISLFDFENRRRIFPGIDSRIKFTLLTIAGVERPADAASFSFFALEVADLSDPERRFPLTADDIRLLNPNTRTCPIFRTRRDAEITKAIYGRVPVLSGDHVSQAGTWAMNTRPGLFHMGNDSARFSAIGVAPDQAGLYEAKHIHIYDHRWGMTGDRQAAPTAEEAGIFRYFVVWPDVRERLTDPAAKWLCGFRDITNSTNERTLIPATFPVAGVGHNLTLLQTTSPDDWLLVALLSSMVVDYIARLKLGGTHMSAFVLRQLAVLAPGDTAGPCPWQSDVPISAWIKPRCVELVYTAEDLREWADHMDFNGRPFRWDPQRRFLIRAELDAAFFHLYGVDRDDADYILDTFPIVKRKDEAAHGEFRTKRVILKCYDAMASAISTGEPYQTLLDPPPAHDSQRHPADSNARA